MKIKQKTYCIKFEFENQIKIFEEFIKVVKKEYGEQWQYYFGLILVVIIENWLKRYWNEKRYDEKIKNQKTLDVYGVEVIS